MFNRLTLLPPTALFALALVSCGDAYVKPNVPASVATSSVSTAAAAQPAAQKNPKDLIAQAQQKKSPQREALLLEAADIYFQQNALDKARNIINELNISQLPDRNFISYSQTAAGIALQEGEIELARRILTNTRLEQQLKALEPRQEAILRELRAQAYERSGQLHESIAERINATPVLTDARTANANQEALWQTLMTLPLNELQTKASSGSGGITQGWYSLAAIGKDNTQNISSQLTRLNQWQAQWRDHPAATNLPKDLRALAQVNTQQPKTIALLLPLQGRLAEAGAAVSDGFFAAYYQQIDNQALPIVRRYDSSQDPAAAYQQAVNDGAELIIGPVDKDGVNKISQLSALKVPVLSLNYPDQQPAQPLANFYQFGLGVEDEARQVARQAFQEGHRRALVVTSAQEVNERNAQAFAAEWQKLGGTIIGKSNFSSIDKFSDDFRRLMLLDDSQSRATLLQQQLGTKLEFTPRRRADVSVIFMAVNPLQGRQIKPTLVFQYAASIPVYATSSIYSGDADAAINEDLNGVLFNTLPWVLDTANPIKESIAQTSKSAAVYGRLHALGVDAFHLSARLTQLLRAPNMQLYGATGSLQLMPDGRIEREQMWARFNQGLVEPLATVVDTSTQEASE